MFRFERSLDYVLQQAQPIRGLGQLVFILQNAPLEVTFTQKRGVSPPKHWTSTV